MINQENLDSLPYLPPPPPINEKPKRTIWRKIGIGFAIFFGIVWASNIVTNARIKDANATAASTVTDPASITSAPTTSSDTVVTAEDAEMVTWAVTALPAVQRIVDISSGIDENADVTELLAACDSLGEAGHDLAVNAPNNSAGDEARAIENAFSQSAVACDNGDFDQAGTFLSLGSDHLTALSTELDKWAN
jgi:hypothetical protein